jgi:CRISPR-associated helicase Cas3
MTLELEITPLAYAQIDADWLPGYQPYFYQWKAYQKIAAALRGQQTYCFLLTTPTGSGKTLASYAYSIRHGLPALGVYPTNELIRDQERALAPEYKRIQDWENWALRIDSRQLDEWGLDLEEPAHAEVLEILLNWRRLILTNPDILYYVAFGRYPERTDRPGQRQRLLALLGSTYRLWIFDEFHLYNVKQMANVAFIIGALQSLNPHIGRAFVFASATPDVEILPLLQERLKLPVEVIQAEPVPPDQGRLITHAIRLTVLPANLDRWQGVQTLVEQAGLLDDFLRRHPQARLVTILDSVAGAIRLASTLRERYPDRPVGEVHGFSSEVQRADALRQPITVGTSTIEVGIDFKGEAIKDVLIFEARTASQFIQRFGRLGRHAKEAAVPNWVVALAPEYVYHAMAAKVGDCSKAVSRYTLYNWLKDAYRVPENFSRYLACHAPAEFVEAKYFLQTLLQPDDRKRILPALDSTIETVSGLRADRAIVRWRQYREREILWPLLTFRGNGFDAAILDKRGTDLGFPAKRYDLMFLLRRGTFEEIDEKTYQETLEQLAQEHPEWAAEAKRELRFARLIGLKPADLLGIYGFFRLKGLLGEGRQVWFEADEDQLTGRTEEITVIEGLEIRTEPGIHARQLTRHLREKRLVAWFTDRHPSALRLGRALPPLFEVYALRVRGPGGRLRDSIWSVAFNQNAFFLDSLYWKKESKKETFII